MRAGIYTNKSKDPELIITKKLESVLREHSFDIVDFVRKKSESDAAPDAFNGCNMVFSVGGDGTILRCVRHAAPMGIPVFGINLGRMGFLTEISADMLDAAVCDIAEGRYSIEERIMLKAGIQDGGQDLYALNDVRLAREQYAGMMNIEIWVNQKYVDIYFCDGILVSSPTGSTAYSLSAGGPVIAPEHNCLLVTPICAHMLKSRPLVINEKDVIQMKVISPKENILSLDGHNNINLANNTRVDIEAAPFKAKFARLSSYNFFDRLRTKL